MDNFSGLVVSVSVRALPGWPLSCPSSFELLLPAPQSRDLPLGAHVQSTSTRRVVDIQMGKKGLTHVSSEMLRTFSP